MQSEHITEGDRVERITKLTNNFTPPEDACTTYRVAFQKLEEFVNDLYTHIHLENNILFPRAVELEGRVMQAGAKA
jgi:regulator of cell morphogenesis and NO signaling